MGSMSRTWLASIRFNPLAPDEIGSSKTFTSARFYEKKIDFMSYWLFLVRADILQ